MIITDIEHIDTQSWEQLLSESPVASWFQSRESYLFFASLETMMTPFVVAVNSDTGELKGVVVGYGTRETNPLKHFFTRRAIIYGGPLLASDITDEELESLLSTMLHSLSRKAIYVETRNFADYSRYRHVFQRVGMAYRAHYDMFIDCEDRELMLSRITESKRRQIRKMRDEGVEVVEAKSEQDILAFFALLQVLYRRKVHRPLFGLDFFTTFVARGCGVLLLVKKGDEVIGGMLCPLLRGRVVYEWYVVGPAYVTWAAMDYANSHGFKLFDLMGAGVPGEPYGVRDFKLQFGGTLKEYGRYFKINSALLYGIGKSVVSLLPRNLL